MAQTRNQELEQCLNYLSYEIYKTYNEIKKINVSMSTISSSIHSTIHSSIEAKTDDINAHMDRQLESFVVGITKLMNPPRGPTSSKQHYNPKGIDSSNSQAFHSNYLHRELHLPRVEVNKFDGLDPTGWITQMEHYFSLHDITNELTKLCYGVLYLDLKHWKWWSWCKNSNQGFVAWT
jgi:hypothetical protein